MKTRFRHMRNILAVAAIGSPMLLFGAFLLFARGHFGWAVLPFLLSLAVSMSLPSTSLRRPEHPERAHPTSMWLGRIASIFCMFWLFKLPEFQSLLDRLAADGAFWDWRLMVAAGIWALNASFSNWRIVRSVSDEEIYAHLCGEPSR